MSFDPTIPQANADLDAVPIRDNFNALKGLIDALPLGTLKSSDGNLDGSGILGKDGWGRKAVVKTNAAIAKVYSSRGN